MNTIPRSTTEHVATYETRGGKIAFHIERHTYRDRVVYSYCGTLGAGSGHPLAELKKTLRVSFTTRRGIKLVSGTDIFSIPESAGTPP